MPLEKETFVTPLGLTLLIVSCILVLVLPRRWALTPVIILTCFMTGGQLIIVANLSFTMLRVLLLFAWMRAIFRGELARLKLNSIDKVLIAWVVAGFLIYVALWRDFVAFQYKLGFAYNAIGLYFLFRFLVWDREDVLRAIKILALLSIPLAAFMSFEKITGQNPFAVLGGVPEWTVIREGRLRCQGPFAHPILAGSFGAGLFALFMGLWWQGRSRLLALGGMVSAVLVAITSGSSGPVGAILAGALGLMLWPLRTYMKAMRRGVILGLLVAQLFMKTPVWFLMGRVKFFAGSDGWHRAFLIDRAAANFFDWWLIGTQNTEAWGYSLRDVTNNYVRQAVDGGLLTLVLFVWIIVKCFAGVGRTIKSLPPDSRRYQLCLWSMGCTLFSHCTSFLGVSYFDQNIVSWYLLLAMIATVAIPETTKEPVKLDSVDYLRPADSTMRMGASRATSQPR